jgi:hypothetical protein
MWRAKFSIKARQLPDDTDTWHHQERMNEDQKEEERREVGDGSQEGI